MEAENLAGAVVCVAECWETPRRLEEEDGVTSEDCETAKAGLTVRDEPNLDLGVDTFRDDDIEEEAVFTVRRAGCSVSRVVNFEALSCDIVEVNVVPREIDDSVDKELAFRDESASAITRDGPGTETTG